MAGGKPARIQVRGETNLTSGHGYRSYGVLESEPGGISRWPELSGSTIEATAPMRSDMACPQVIWPRSKADNVLNEAAMPAIVVGCLIQPERFLIYSILFIDCGLATAPGTCVRKSGPH